MCSVFRFPHPTGHHGIGTVTYHWVDADRPEAFTADPDDRRELMVQLWYPAPPDPAAPRAPYVRDAAAPASALTPLELTPGQKGRPAALLDGPAEQYPEVLCETRRP